MKKKYETLDEYLDDLDKIKECLSKELQQMDAKQRQAHYAEVRERVQKKLEAVQPLDLSGWEAPPARKRSSRGRLPGNKYETLDEYLDDLDKIKEQLADEIKGMDAKQVEAFFAERQKQREEKTKTKARVSGARRKHMTTRRS